MHPLPEALDSTPIVSTSKATKSDTLFDLSSTVSSVSTETTQSIAPRPQLPSQANVASPTPSASPQLISPVTGEFPEVKHEQEDSFNEDLSFTTMNMDIPEEEGDDIGLGVGQVATEIEHPHDEIVSLEPPDMAEEDFSLPEEELENMENDVYDG